MTLLLSKAGDSPDVGDGTIEYFRDLIGPKDVNIAKEEAPTRYSSQSLQQHASLCVKVHACTNSKASAVISAHIYKTKYVTMYCTLLCVSSQQSLN